MQQSGTFKSTIKLLLKYTSQLGEVSDDDDFNSSNHNNNNNTYKCPGHSLTHSLTHSFILSR